MGRFFNPPSEIPSIGRPLDSGTYAQLVTRLRPSEVLFGVYRSTVVAGPAGGPKSAPYSFDVAQYLDSQDAFNSIGDDVPVAYYAVSITDANVGLSEPIPTQP